MSELNPWMVRFTWDVKDGFHHPRQSTSPTYPTRGEAVTAGWATWSRRHHGMTVAAVHIRELPNGPWVDLDPELPCCGLEPGQATACAMPGADGPATASQ